MRSQAADKASKDYAAKVKRDVEGQRNPTMASGVDGPNPWGPDGESTDVSDPLKERPPLFDTAQLQKDLKDKINSPFHVGPFHNEAENAAQHQAGSMSGFMSSAMYSKQMADRGGPSQLHTFHRGAAREINISNPSGRR